MNSIVTDVKTAIVVAAGSVSSGLGTVFNLIPDDIGNLATLTGIILSSVLIYTHWRKGRIEYEKTRLEIELMKKNIKED